MFHNSKLFFTFFNTYINKNRYNNISLTKFQTELQLRLDIYSKCNIYTGEELQHLRSVVERLNTDWGGSIRIIYLSILLKVLLQYLYGVSFYLLIVCKTITVKWMNEWIVGWINWWIFGWVYTIYCIYVYDRHRMTLSQLLILIAIVPSYAFYFRKTTLIILAIIISICFDICLNMYIFNFIMLSPLYLYMSICQIYFCFDVCALQLCTNMTYWCSWFFQSLCNKICYFSTNPWRTTAKRLR